MRGSPCSPPSAWVTVHSIFVVPRILRRLSVRQPHEREECPGCGHAQESTQHRRPVDMIVGSYPIHAQDGRSWFRVRCCTQHVPDAICPRPGGQSVLEGRTFCLEHFAELLCECSCHKTPQRTPCCDAPDTPVWIRQSCHSRAHQSLRYLAGDSSLRQTVTSGQKPLERVGVVQHSLQVLIRPPSESWKRSSWCTFETREKSLSVQMDWHFRLEIEDSPQAMVQLGSADVSSACPGKWCRSLGPPLPPSDIGGLWTLLPS